MTDQRERRDGHAREPEALKVGELGRRTGLSVRTLHHYDEIGLLSPARRTASGTVCTGETRFGASSRSAP